MIASIVPKRKAMVLGVVVLVLDVHVHDHSAERLGPEESKMDDSQSPEVRWSV